MEFIRFIYNWIQEMKQIRSESKAYWSSSIKSRHYSPSLSMKYQEKRWDNIRRRIGDK